jgi:hypothetical protein
VLYHALNHLGYNGDVPLYRRRPSQAHGLNMCEVRVEIPFGPRCCVIGSELDHAIEKMEHVVMRSGTIATTSPGLCRMELGDLP